MAWHSAYESRTSSLRRRVAVVRARLSEVLAERSPETTLLSLCAGDGRDVFGIDRRLLPARVTLVELDEELARRAALQAAELPMVEVRCGDASDTATIADVLPVDVLLLCGVLGNVEPSTVGGIVERIAGLLGPGGTVIWTRGGSTPDQRRPVRDLFVSHGFDELSFDGEPDPFGVGVSRLSAEPPNPPTGTPLFTFVR